MANYTFTFKDDSLEHHGIDGQKWGVRNGPPYPLAEGQHSDAEKRAMRRSDKQSYRVVKKANKKSWKHKNPIEKSNKLAEKVISSIHDHGDDIRAITSPLQLDSVCRSIANEVLGDYATKSVYTTTRQRTGFIIKKTVSKSKEYVGSASSLLAEALKDMVTDMYSE